MPHRATRPLFRAAHPSAAPAAATDQAGVRPVPPAQWPPASSPTWAMVGCTPAEVGALQESLAGFVAFPGLPDYEQARAGEAGWPTPRVIAYCQAESDVALCLAFARRNDWLVSIRSGGHNTGGYHLCDGLVVDVSGLRELVIDDATGLITVGPGLTFDDLDTALAEHGLALPTGTCGNVCCAGYFMGGGYSLVSRSLGIGSDAVVAARVITADGTAVVASATENRELFWALRGGSGGQFGVLVEWTLQGTRPDTVWAFLAQWSLADAPEVLAYLEAHHMWEASPRSEPFGYLVAITYLIAGEPEGNGGIEPQPSLAVLGMFRGTEAEARHDLAGLFATGAPTFRYAAQTHYAVANSALFGYFPYVELDLEDAHSVAFSGYVAPEGRVDWASLVAVAARAPNPGNLIAVEPYGGAIAAADAGTSAFPHRSQKLDVMVDSFWNPSWEGTYLSTTRSSAEAWLAGAQEVVAPALSGRTYVNYADRTLRDYRKQYWAQSFDQLLAVRTQWDPDDVFHFDQSISWAPDPPSGTAGGGPG